MLKVTNLCKAYKNFSINNISFEVEKGKITGFIGNNGVGKTTTLKCILGLLHYDSGEITVDGISCKERKREYLDKLGVVFDGSCFYENMTIAAMKEIVACAYTNWEESKFDNYMDIFNLDRKQKITKLSKGMKMKFSLALALSHNAEYLVLDEPAGGLDPKSREMLSNILLEEKKSGRTILVSTHITSDLDKIADDIILMNDGEIVTACTKEEFLKRSDNGNVYSNIEEAMLDKTERKAK